MRCLRWIALVPLAATLAASLQQALLAFDFSSMGARGPRFSWIVGVAVLTLLAFGIVIAAASTSERATAVLRRSWPTTLVFVAAAAFVMARFHAYDPYYLPTLRRYSTNGSGAWPAVVACSGLATAIAVRRFGSVALALGGMVVWLCALTVMLAGFGH